MKAGPVEVGTLLQNRNRYCVPIYQRHYVWEWTKQWEPFWLDVRTKAIERLDGRERRFSHFMGALVLESRGKPSVKQVPSFQVVDGQQRLTTFQLFLTAARHYAIELGYETAAENIKRYLMNSDPHLMEDPDVEVLKVWPTEYDRELFKDLILLPDRAALRDKYIDHWYKNKKRDQIRIQRSTPNLLGAYGYFYDHIKLAVETDDLTDDLLDVEEPDEPEVENESDQEVEGVPEVSAEEIPKELKLDAIWQSLLEEFKIVEIVLDEGDDAQVIFETLNERGEPLLAADLVRNNIFQRADASKEDAEALFAKHWKPFEDVFWAEEEKQGRYKKQRIEFFLSNFIAGKIAGEVSLSKLFSEYKSYLRPKKGQTEPRYATVESELKDLAGFGGIYRDLIERKSGSDLATFSKKLRRWDVTTVYPLVLRLWDTDQLETEEKKEALSSILSFVVRRAVCGLTTKNYNKFFLTVVEFLDQSGWSIDNLQAFIQKQSAESTRYPQDEEFERAVIDSPMYKNLGSARTNAFLCELELSLRGKKQEEKTLPDGLSVEHVLPQSWHEHWPLDCDEEPTDDDFFRALFEHTEDDSMIGQIVRRNRLLHSVGNLTLVTPSFNSSVQNYAFDVKRKEFADQSTLMLNKAIASETGWNEKTISTRGATLAKAAVNIWRM